MYTFFKRSKNSTENDNGTATGKPIGSTSGRESPVESEPGSVGRSDEGSQLGGELGMAGDSGQPSLSTRNFGVGSLADLIDARRFLARRISHEIRNTERLSKLISWVCKSSNGPEDKTLVSFIKTKAPNALFKWCVRHGDHYHVVHDCTYSNGCCRCFNKIPTDRRTRRIVSTQGLTEKDVELLVQYHFQGGRTAYNVQVRSHDYTRLFSGMQAIRSEQDSSGAAELGEHVETCDIQDKVLWDTIRGYGDVSSFAENDVSDCSDYQSESGRRRKSRSIRSTQKEKKENEQVRLERFIMQIGKVPLSDFVTTTDFIESEWRFHNEMSTVFKNALKFAKYKFYNFQLRDYRNYYENLTIMPYWDTTNRDMFTHKYMSVAMSKKLLYKLLIFQTCGPQAMENLETGTVRIDYEWKPAMYAYVRELIEFIDKKRGKMNTDVYISPPCAGKTLFMDLIRDYLINCGQMANWNRNSNFPLQTCGYTRVIFWNEPNYEISVESNLLKLLGGDSLNASVKNQNDVNIEKTPVFVTSNKDPFPHSPEFNYRLRRHEWRAAPFLKVCGGKKLHPLSFQYLINECENYYRDDITEYEVKYNNTTVKENNVFERFNVLEHNSAYGAETSEEELTDDENVNQGESSFEEEAREIFDAEHDLH